MVTHRKVKVVTKVGVYEYQQNNQLIVDYRFSMVY